MGFLKMCTKKYSWGLKELDEKAKSLESGSPYIFAAQKGHGKTRMAVHLAMSFKAQAEGAVLFFGERKDEHRIAQTLKEAGVVCHFAERFEFESMCRKIENAKIQHRDGVGAVIVDPIQRVFMGGYEEVLEKMREENADPGILESYKHDIWLERVNSVGRELFLLPRESSCIAFYTAWMGPPKDGQDDRVQMIGEWENYIKNVCIGKKTLQMTNRFEMEVRPAWGWVKPFLAKVSIPASSLS